MDYSKLDVQEGGQAQLVWGRMINEKNPNEKEKLIAHLLEYCRLDTLAMVEIHKVLLKLP